MRERLNPSIIKLCLMFYKLHFALCTFCHSKNEIIRFTEWHISFYVKLIIFLAFPITHVFFLSGFSFMNIHVSQKSGGRGRIFHWIIEKQGKRETILLTPLYHFHQLRKHLYSSRAVDTENSPLYIASGQNQTENPCLNLKA